MNLDPTGLVLTAALILTQVDCASLQPRSHLSARGCNQLGADWAHVRTPPRLQDQKAPSLGFFTLSSTHASGFTSGSHVLLRARQEPSLACQAHDQSNYTHRISAVRLEGIFTLLPSSVPIQN